LFGGDAGRAGGYLEARARPLDWLSAFARGELGVEWGGVLDEPRMGWRALLGLRAEF
jgi:hypothetical protein